MPTTQIPPRPTPRQKLELRVRSDEYYDAVDSIIRELPKSVIREGLNHPVVQALQQYLLGYYSSIFEEWQSGAYSDTSEHGTRQLGAASMGRVNAIDEVLNFLNTLGDYYND